MGGFDPFVADPDWATLFKAADGEFHSQNEFGDLIVRHDDLRALVLAHLSPLCSVSSP